MSSKDEKSASRIWTKEEKRKLLQLIKLEGHTNYEKIAHSFSNKSPLAIKAKVNKYIALSKSSKPGSADPLDFWLYSYFQKNDDALISRALLFIQLFENHPTTEETNGVEFDSIYEFLHRLTLGHPPNNITTKSWDAFNAEMKKATELVTSKSEKEVLTHLSTLNIKPKPGKDYSRGTS